MRLRRANVNEDRPSFTTNTRVRHDDITQFIPSHARSSKTVKITSQRRRERPCGRNAANKTARRRRRVIRQPFSSWSFARGRCSLVLLVALRCHPAGGEQLVGRVSEQALQVAHEAIDVSLAGRLVDDVLVVVVTQAARQLLVVHLRLVLADAPAARHLVRVGQLELPIIARPRDEVLAVLVRQLLEQELPQLDRAAPCERTRDRKYQHVHVAYEAYVYMMISTIVITNTNISIASISTHQLVNC